MKSVSVQKITPILLVEALELCVKFLTERMGFEKTIEVPDGDKLAFALLKKGDLEIMYQSFDSADKSDTVVGVLSRKGPSFLYIEVADLKEIVGALQGIDLAVPVHETFYGAKELSVKDPAGHFISFAQQGAADQQ